jgi:protein-S-isoprenylcysteine O-methyltransferase Ste14
VVQFVLVGVVLFGPASHPALPAFFCTHACLPAGALLLICGGGLFVAGLLALGPNLSPLPVPKQGASFTESGPYRWVRHPIYAGALLLALGWALVIRGWLTLGYVIVLAVFFDIKARREERRLLRTFPEYADYRRRVRRFIPRLY